MKISPDEKQKKPAPCSKHGAGKNQNNDMTTLTEPANEPTHIDAERLLAAELRKSGEKFAQIAADRIEELEKQLASARAQLAIAKAAGRKRQSDWLIDTQAVKQFVTAASSGHRDSASSGERVAAALAKALEGIGDDMSLLDSTLLEGACSLMRCMSGPWPTDEIKTDLFRLVRMAAGRRAAK